MFHSNVNYVENVYYGLISTNVSTLRIDDKSNGYSLFMYGNHFGNAPYVRIGSNASNIIENTNRHAVLHINANSVGTIEISQAFGTYINSNKAIKSVHFHRLHPLLG